MKPSEQIELIKLVDSDAELDYGTICRIEKLRETHPFMEDRSAKLDYLSARCPAWLREDFEYVSRCIEGEDPSVVLRRLVRNYIRKAMSATT